MPRISRQLVAERETLTTKNFEAGMSIDAANNELVKNYGMKMAPGRLRELFDAASKPAETVAPVAVTGPLHQAHSSCRAFRSLFQ